MLSVLRNETIGGRQSPLYVHTIITTMKFATSFSIAEFFYLGVDTQAGKDDEQFGLSIGRFYVGLYNNVLSIGILDDKGCLP